MAAGLSMQELFYLPNLRAMKDIRGVHNIVKLAETGRKKLDQDFSDVIMLVRIFLKCVTNDTYATHKYGLHDHRTHSFRRSIAEIAKRLSPIFPQYKEQLEALTTSSRKKQQPQAKQSLKEWIALESVDISVLRFIISMTFLNKAGLLECNLKAKQHLTAFANHNLDPTRTIVLGQVPAALFEEDQLLKSLSHIREQIQHVIFSPKVKISKKSKEEYKSVAIQFKEEETLRTAGTLISPPLAATILRKSVFNGSIQACNPNFGLAPVEPESVEVSDIQVPWRNSWKRIGARPEKENITAVLVTSSCLSFLYAKQDSIIYAVSGSMTLGEHRFRASKLTLLPQEDNLLALIVLLLFQSQMQVKVLGDYITEIQLIGGCKASTLHLEYPLHIAFLTQLKKHRQLFQNCLKDPFKLPEEENLYSQLQHLIYLAKTFTLDDLSELDPGSIPQMVELDVEQPLFPSKINEDNSTEKKQQKSDSEFSKEQVQTTEIEEGKLEPVKVSVDDSTEELMDPKSQNQSIPTFASQSHPEFAELASRVGVVLQKTDRDALILNGIEMKAEPKSHLRSALRKLKRTSKRERDLIPVLLTLLPEQITMLEFVKMLKWAGAATGNTMQISREKHKQYLKQISWLQAAGYCIKFIENEERTKGEEIEEKAPSKTEASNEEEAAKEGDSIISVVEEEESKPRDSKSQTDGVKVPKKQRKFPGISNAQIEKLSTTLGTTVQATENGELVLNGKTVILVRKRSQLKRLAEMAIYTRPVIASVLSTLRGPITAEKFIQRLRHTSAKQEKVDSTTQNSVPSQVVDQNAKSELEQSNEEPSVILYYLTLVDVIQDEQQTEILQIGRTLEEEVADQQDKEGEVKKKIGQSTVDILELLSDEQRNTLTEFIQRAEAVGIAVSIRQKQKVSKKKQTDMQPLRSMCLYLNGKEIQQTKKQNIIEQVSYVVGRTLSEAKPFLYVVQDALEIIAEPIAPPSLFFMVRILRHQQYLSAANEGYRDVFFVPTSRKGKPQRNIPDKIQYKDYNIEFVWITVKKQQNPFANFKQILVGFCEEKKIPEPKWETTGNSSTGIIPVDCCFDSLAVEVHGKKFTVALPSLSVANEEAARQALLSLAGAKNSQH